MPARREIRIDFIRGLALLAIFVGHAGFDFSDAFQQARGFSDASEIFVLLAGVSAALAYWRPSGFDPEAASAKTLRRALRLYLVHLAMVAALLLSVALPPIASRPAIVAELGLDTFGAAPVRNAVEIVLLSFMPGDLDILPLYVFLIVATPFFLALHERSRRLLLALSGGLALAFGALKLDFVNDAMPAGGWYFDPLSWQFVFVIGLCIGVGLKRGRDPLAYRPWLFRLAATFVLTAIPANLLLHFVFTEISSSHLVHALVSKTFVGPLRLANALALLYVLWNLSAVKRLTADGALAPVFAAGAASLPVFVFGLALSTLCQMLMASEVAIPLAAQACLAVGGCLAQLVLATHLGERKLKRRNASVPLAASLPQG
ncbi:OpgC domain-containing protein [Antarcticirhabdus aurantiaca]|uniref:OpgC domain-containing protein n=1 Tax=Antarcticirhabdus aurantiaca TaxID=2606717 RepID=A0ACD4NUD7_9HYPH|nr:OpgC domain-containing protein [Antarcticirhabdus aurantiaca]WAJ30407.1 OpgC domain-containing protein [Jeongeuplla avenae]